MKTTTLALLSVIGSAAAQGVTGKISPQGNAPDGCSANFDGKFQIGPQKSNSKRAACDGTDGLVVTLKDGQVFDSQGRTGYIASNYQFQFDGPPQAGAIYTSGFSVCKNGSFAFGSTTTLYQCLSGSFYNLYDRSWAAQCGPVQLVARSCAAAAAGQQADGQVTVGTAVATTTIVKPISDGQPQVITTVVPVPLCQISDGQLQIRTTPCASVTSVARPTTTIIPISQISDGQIQVTPGVGGMPPAPTPGSASATRTSGPAPTAPPATGSAGTTLRTSASSGSSAPATQTRSSSASSPTSSGTTVSGAGTVEMGSLAALAVGILGAVWVL